MQSTWKRCRNSRQIRWPNQSTQMVTFRVTCGLHTPIQCCWYTATLGLISQGRGQTSRAFRHYWNNLTRYINGITRHTLPILRSNNWSVAAEVHHWPKFFNRSNTHTVVTILIPTRSRKQKRILELWLRHHQTVASAGNYEQILRFPVPLKCVLFCPSARSWNWVTENRWMNTGNTPTIQKSTVMMEELFASNFECFDGVQCRFHQPWLIYDVIIHTRKPLAGFHSSMAQ